MASLVPRKGTSEAGPFVPGGAREVLDPIVQPIPPAEGRSPDGPRTRVLPKLLRLGRTHAANLPIPEGLVPCLTIHLSRPDPDRATMDQQGD